MLGGGLKLLTGALSVRAGERTVKHTGRDGVDPLAVARAPRNLRSVKDPCAWRERVGLMAELLERLPGAPQPPVEPAQRGDGPRERPPERGGELLRVIPNGTLVNPPRTRTRIVTSANRGGRGAERLTIKPRA